MSILVERLLFCDGGPSCPKVSPYNADTKKADTTNAEIRRIAALSGWAKHGGKDYCEACAVRLGHAAQN